MKDSFGFEKIEGEGCPDFVPKEEKPKCLACNKRDGTIICVQCGKIICGYCVADYHYSVGPLCYDCFRVEQRQQQTISDKAF